MLYFLVFFVLLFNLGKYFAVETIEMGSRTTYITPGWFNAIMIIPFLATIIAWVTISVRRLHDSNHTGWWFFVFFIPGIGGFIKLVFMLLKTDPYSEYSDHYFDDVMEDLE